MPRGSMSHALPAISSGGVAAHLDIVRELTLFGSHCLEGPVFTHSLKLKPLAPNGDRQCMLQRGRPFRGRGVFRLLLGLVLSLQAIKVVVRCS